MEEIVNILIVDDVPENLQLLSNILKERNYRVRTLPSGKLVMKSIENNRPDLILLDINMPEMNGYEVCKLVKAKFKDIPIIFISAMNEVFDKVKAFNVGGVDYIAKPFYVDEVYARIKTHIELSRSKHEIQTLLTKTLSGSIKMMTELIASSKPKVFDQASRLKKYALMTAQQLGMANVWKLELAAMFSSTGYVAVSDAIVEKKFSVLELDEEEKKTLDLAFSKSVQLIKNIPRLEDVAEMININGLDNKVSEEVKLGRDILKVVLDYDNYFLTGDSDEKIIKMMQTMEELYNKKVLDAFAEAINKEKCVMPRKLLIKELAEGMVVLEDIITDKGTIIAAKNSIITKKILDAISYYNFKEHIAEPIKAEVCNGK